MKTCKQHPKARSISVQHVDDDERQWVCMKCGKKLGAVREDQSGILPVLEEDQELSRRSA